jgi:F0F1-type ATP synthase membrane subunit b/b'
MLILEQLIYFLVVLAVLYFFVYSPLSVIIKPYWKEFQAKQRVRIAESDLEAAKAERKVTELELKAQEEINGSIEDIVSERKHRS